MFNIRSIPVHCFLGKRYISLETLKIITNDLPATRQIILTSGFNSQVKMIRGLECFPFEILKDIFSKGSNLNGIKKINNSKYPIFFDDLIQY